MQIIDIEHVSFEENGVPNLTKHNHKSSEKRFIILSILAHSFVVLVIISNLNFSEPDAQEPIDIKKPKLKSYLYTPPIPKENEAENVVEEKAKLTTNTTSEPKEETSAVAEKPDDIIQKEVTLTPGKTAPEKVLNQPISAVNDDATSNEQKQNISPQQKMFSKYGLRNNIQRQLQAIEANKLQTLAQSASREYTTSLVSPEIVAPTYSEEYLYSKQADVHLVTCDDTIKSKLALLSGFMGGKVKCRNQNFQIYIDKYLNKEPEKE